MLACIIFAFIFIFSDLVRLLMILGGFRLH